MTLQYNYSEGAAVNDYVTCIVNLIFENSIQRFLKGRDKKRDNRKKKKKKTKNAWNCCKSHNAYNKRVKANPNRIRKPVLTVRETGTRAEPVKIKFVEPESELLS